MAAVIATAVATGVIATAADVGVKDSCSCICVRVNHICHLNRNLDALEKAMLKLKAKRDDVLGRVEMDEDTGLQRFNEVQQWLASVGTIENEVDEMRIACTGELQGFSLFRVCSKKLKTRVRYGKKVFLMLEDVEDLILTGKFDAVAGKRTRDVAEQRPLQLVVGQDTILERAWNRLMDEESKIVGIFGMGGVGKTTLLNQINNKFRDINDGFDVVIWVVVSTNATIHNILGDIGEKLRLKGWEWDKKSESQKALDIHNILKTKKFVLLLDDMWEKVNLNVIGVPYPNRENGCKVAFTTRSRDVCGRMEVDDPIEVSCLDPDKAWDLFTKKVGDKTLANHPDIPELARKVVGECHGLPLALNVIGETMASRSNIQEWHRAIDVLSSTASKFPGMKDEILPILKYSYDSLNDEQVQSCFLYCSLLPEDSILDQERLIEYWIAERFIDEDEGGMKAIYEGYEIIGTLVRACLLLEGIGWDDKPQLKMHDVVRDMALWIASDLGKHKEKCIVHAGVRLLEIPRVNNWKTVKRMSLMKNDIGTISESHECPELTTLLLGGSIYLETISGGFFSYMPSLLVLDLSRNVNLVELPEEISGLVSLRYLDLSKTKIKRLSIGLQELKMLIHLNLESTSNLRSLQGISNLESLRTLKLLDSQVWLDMSLMKELELLQHLEFVTISISSSLVGEQLLYDSRVGRCMQHVFIRDLSGETVRVLNFPCMDNLREVSIKYCGMLAIKAEKRGWNKSLTGPSLFSNLSVVLIDNCHGLKDLTWLLFTPNLVSLSVWDSKTIEEIISEQKASGVLEETCNILPFQKLEVLSLEELPELKSIYWKALPFQRVRNLNLLNCRKLRKLPLDSKSVDKVEDLVIKYNGGKRLAWEDEATRERFRGRVRYI